MVSVAAPVDELREFISSEKERLEIPGVAVALIDRGNVEYIPLGVRRAGSNEPISSADPFDIASIGKTITPWAVMVLAEQGLVDLDAPVQQYFGQRWQFPPSEFDSAAVTLRRILSHTAGLSAPRGFGRSKRRR